MTKKLLALLLAAILSSMLPVMAEEALPRVPAAEPALLNAAANAPGSTLEFANPVDASVWPMIPAEEDGFSCLTSTNWGADSSVSAVYVRVTAQAGDALAFRYKTSLETGFDLLQLCVDGAVVKVFTGEGDWRQYAWAFPADGEYEVAFRVSKDNVSAAGSDAAYIRDVRLLSGDAAQAALAENPAYPAAGERALTVRNARAREIVFDDPTFALTGLYGLARYYIVPGDSLEVSVILAREDDPDGAILAFSGADAQNLPVAAGAGEAGYAFTLPAEERTHVQLIPARDCSPLAWRTVMCFSGEEAADAFLAMLQVNGYQVAGWRYVNQTACALTVIDQHGEFMEGVTVTVRTAKGVQVLSSDADGAVSFTLPEGVKAEVHIVDVPEGFTFDPERVWSLDAENAEAIIDVTRAEQ